MPRFLLCQLLIAPVAFLFAHAAVNGRRWLAGFLLLIYIALSVFNLILFTGR